MFILSHSVTVSRREVLFLFIFNLPSSIFILSHSFLSWSLFLFILLSSFPCMFICSIRPFTSGHKHIASVSSWSLYSICSSIFLPSMFISSIHLFSFCSSITHSVLLWFFFGLFFCSQSFTFIYSPHLLHICLSVSMLKSLRYAQSIT